MEEGAIPLVNCGRHCALLQFIESKIKSNKVTMAPRTLADARLHLPRLLLKNPGAKSTELAGLAQVSTPTMVRMLNEMEVDVLRLGKARGTRYFLRRSLRGLPSSAPVFALDQDGVASKVGQLALIAPQGTVLDVAGMGWPVEKEFAQGVWADGLPYPLQDMKPQGFMGRQFAHQESGALGISSNPREWRDDDILLILLSRGADTSGNLIVGDTALNLWLQSKAGPQAVLGEDSILAGYAACAEQASSRGIAGSSAGGEFPKFTAMRELPGARTVHVIVKYSANDRSDTVRRWSDLLICEHHALQAIRRIPGVQSASSRVLQHGGRTFLEVERFDRHGLFGRSPLCSLDTLEASMLPGTSTDWGDAGDMMQAQGWLNADAAKHLRSIWAFGKLISNTDMHKGNLSFVPGPNMQVAPVYDMLPMAYAPMAGGEIPTPGYAPGLPKPKDRDAWLAASQAAQDFWLLALQDDRISERFRQISEANLQELSRLMKLA